ncbi:MAG TPA: DUF4190 domain-containing protein [Chthoniobacterales bacterium]|nr:DUF4190 domain-containing protein [Chthoniobacterales bacterium]
MIDSSSSTMSAGFNAANDDLPTLPLWAFTLGVFSLLTLGITSVPAIICGHKALAEGRQSNKGSLGRSVALTGLVIGYVGAALLGTWIIVAARLLSMH